MGLLDQLVSGALRGSPGGPDDSQSSQSQLLPALLGQLLGQTNFGNVGGLLQQLQQGGLGREVSSWLSNGSNMPVSPDQLRSALGSDDLQRMTQTSGLPLDALLAVLSRQLPQTVDRMSPQGSLDESLAAPSDDPGGSLADRASLRDIGR